MNQIIFEFAVSGLHIKRKQTSISQIVLKQTNNYGF